MAAKTSARQYIAEKMKAGIGYRVKAVADGKTCAECKAKNGLYQNGQGPKPPFHLNCRCGETTQ